MPKITPQQNMPVSFRIAPSMDAAVRRVAEVNQCEPGDVLREALYRWSHKHQPKWLASESSDWLGFSPRQYTVPYGGAQTKQLPKERKTKTVCFHVPGRAIAWYERASKAYDTPTSRLYFAAVVELLRELQVAIHEANRPMLKKPDPLKLPPKTTPPSFDPAAFEVGDEDD